MSALRLIPGTIFAGDFEIVGPLAEGGMGSVYVARQRSTGKERALKIMQPGLAADVRTRERFTREARAGSQIDSEHVVEVVAAGIDAETNVPWLAMELLRGEDLGSFAERVGPLPAVQTLEIFRQLCHGLSAAHASGLVHRDLKPENVFLATARRVGVPFTVKILDFGIAKVVQETKHEVTDAVGTPVWMSPEQTEAGRAITPAADVWALGLIAFRLLTGFLYWKSANAAGQVSAMAILREVVFEPLEPASIRARSLGSAVTLSREFDGWFARCVVRAPDMRLPNAAAALGALEKVLAHASGDSAVAPTVPPTPPPTVRGEPFQPTPKREPKFSAVAETAHELPPTRVGPFTGSADCRPPNASSRPPTEDVDLYEKRLSRGKWWAWATLGLVALGAGYGVYRYREQAAAPQQFTGGEREPNNRAPEANPLPFGEKMRAQIGQRLDGARSDRDFFRVAVPPGTSLVRLKYGALANIAPCLFVYRVGRDEPLHRLCIGQPGRDLAVPQLRLEPAEYLLAVMQDREQYTEDPPPPVLENISDAYELELEPADPASDLELEPNDGRESATVIEPGAVLRGKLAWMRDVDVFCVPGGGEGTVKFVVEDGAVRPRGAVLEVTPLGGPNDGIPVRVHHSAAEGAVTERDVKSPWQGPPITDLSAGACVSLTLTRDIWSQPPFPRVAPAGDQEYVVRVEE